jgi:hypothetical protein
VPRVDHDPRILGPGLAPTPFTADQIRAGCPAGRTIRLLVEEDGAEPYVRYNRFTACDDAGATIERGRVDDPAGVETEHTTWAELQAHAAFPAIDTAIEPETIDIPLGVVDCHRYTVGSGERVHVFWFAPEHPGMPVRIVRRESGRTTSRTTMIASEVDG